MEETSESVEKSTILDTINQNHCQKTTENASENDDLTTTTSNENPSKDQTIGGPMPFPCPKCPKRLFRTQESLDIHLEQHKTGQYICQICSKICKHQASLKAHLRVHSEERPYACTICDFRFKFLGGLKNHVKLHANLKFTCPICGKEFKDLNNCKWHEKKHSQNYKRTHSCKICDKTFIVKCLLTYHMRTHTGERPNVCETCGAAFADKSNLQKHYRIHTGERPFKCEQCDKSFSQKSSLTCHRRSHVTFKPHICSHCGKAFGLPEELIVHLRVHGEHQMFKCNMCDQEFREHCFLKSHQRIHSHKAQKQRKEWKIKENMNLDDVSLYLKDGETHDEALAKQNTKELSKIEKEKEIWDISGKKVRKPRKRPEKKPTDKVNVEKINKIIIKKESTGNILSTKPTRRRKKKETIASNTVEKKSRTKRKIVKEIPTYNENDESDYDGGGGGGGDFYHDYAGFDSDGDDEYVPEVNITVNNQEIPIIKNKTNDKWENLIIEPIKIENVTKTEDYSVNNENKPDIPSNLTAEVDGKVDVVQVSDAVDVKFENKQQEKRKKKHVVNKSTLISADIEEVIVKVEFDPDDIVQNQVENNKVNETSPIKIDNKFQIIEDIDIKHLTPIVLLEQIDPEILKKYSKSLTLVGQSKLSASRVKKSNNQQSKRQTTNPSKPEPKRSYRKKLSPKLNECKTINPLKEEIKSEIKQELSNYQIKNDIDLIENKELVLTTTATVTKTDDNQSVDIAAGISVAEVNLEQVKTIKTVKKKSNKLKESTKTPRKKSTSRVRKFANSYQCKLCPKGYTTPSRLAWHSILHLKGSFICATCQLDCLTLDQLKEHMKTNLKCHPKTHKLYKCTFCERHYLTRYDLTEHIDTHFKIKRFVCDICDKKFNKKPMLAKHMRRHTDEKPQFKCEICLRCYYTVSELKMHQQCHSNERPYKCDVCEKTFKSAGQCKNHKRIHNGDLYKCSYCGKSFNVLGNLQIHELRHSGSENIFKCTLCPKSFLFKHKLTYHQRVHTGERPFGCSNCDARFADKSNLVKHYRIHSGIKPYQCSVCNKLFNQLSSLNSHKKSHITFKPFKCSYCGKCFPIEADLIIHLRAHGEFRKFKCNFCDKEYDELCHMKSHRRLHTNESHISDDRIVSVEYETWDRLRKMQETTAAKMSTTEILPPTKIETEPNKYLTTTVTNGSMNNEVFIITELSNSAQYSQKIENEDTTFINL